MNQADEQQMTAGLNAAFFSSRAVLVLSAFARNNEITDDLSDVCHQVATLFTELASPNGGSTHCPPVHAIIRSSRAPLELFRHTPQGKEQPQVAAWLSKLADEVRRVPDDTVDIDVRLATAKELIDLFLAVSNEATRRLALA